MNLLATDRMTLAKVQHHPRHLLQEPGSRSPGAIKLLVYIDLETSPLFPQGLNDLMSWAAAWGLEKYQAPLTVCSSYFHPTCGQAALLNNYDDVEQICGRQLRKS